MVNESRSRLFKFPQSQRWALVSAVVVLCLSAGNSWGTPSSNAEQVPTAQILETQVVVRGEGDATWHRFDFDVPKAGTATLRLSNGAHRDAPSVDRVEGAEITLRGEGVVTPKEFNQQIDVFEVPVELQPGTNQLDVRLQADSGKRVSVRIEAPADSIVLAPVLNAIVLEDDPLRAQATVTGLGRPVHGAKVRFKVNKLGPTVEQNSVTGTAGTATGELSEFDVGAGELRATVVGTNLSTAVPITAIAQRTLSMRQRPESVRLEVGAGRAFGLTINLREMQGDQDLVTVKHVVQSLSGGNPAGVVVHSDFPSQGQSVAASKNISVRATVTGVKPGRYSVTTTVAVIEKASAKARETFRTELAVEVVPPGTPDPLRLSTPRISPSGLAPGTKQVVMFRTLLVGVSNPPPILYLDRVSNRGEFIAQETELRDDGKKADAKAGDGFYSGQRELGSDEEMEFYFRLRTEYFGKPVTSGSAVLPITRLPLGSRPSTGPVIANPKGQSQIFTNEVVVGMRAGVSPGRVQAIVAEVGATLELHLPDVPKIVGYIPSLASYLVEFQGDGTLQGVQRARAAFSAYAEVKYASPSIEGRPAGTWLSNIKVDQLRSSAAPSGLPVYSSGGIGVAIIDNGVNCNDPDLTGKCAIPNSPWPMAGSCLDMYNIAKASASTTHGTKVAALVAGQSGAANLIQGVDEGVAWNTTLLPFGVTNGFQQHAAAAAMDCAVTAGAHILNVSREWDTDVTDGAHPEGVLKDAACTAVCNNRLVVAAAGNFACTTYSPRYPASYNDGTTCACGPDITAGDQILKVGGTDLGNAEGVACGLGTPNKKSQLGEIYAPGWGVPVVDNSDPLCAWNGCYGTSWSAALVSGCAAILGAVQKSMDAAWWNPNFIEEKLRTTASGLPLLLDCQAALVDSVNFAPVLDNTGMMTLPNINEDEADPVGDTVDRLIVSAGGDRITDVDSGAMEGIAVIGVEDNNGTWQYSTGSNWSDFGAVTDTSAVLLNAAASIRFVPNANYHGSAGNITFRAWDTTIGNNGDRGVNVSTNGGLTAYSTATETATLTVNSINDAPVLDNTGTMTLPNINEDEADPVGDTVDRLIVSAGGDRITDVDSGAMEGIAVIGVEDNNGTWQYNTGNGWTVFGAVTNTRAVLLNAAAYIRFVPNPNFTGWAGEMTFRAWDQTTGSNGATSVDVSTNGGSTAYSEDTETATVTVDPVNDDKPPAAPSGVVVQ